MEATQKKKRRRKNRKKKKDGADNEGFDSEEDDLKDNSPRQYVTPGDAKIFNLQILNASADCQSEQ